MRLIDADALIDRIKNPYEQAQVARWVNEQHTIEPEKRTEKRTETHACDLIDREAAVDAIYHHLPSVSRMEARLMLHEVPSAQAEPFMVTIDHELTKDEVERLKQSMSNAPIVLFPSVQPEQRWIPCSERLPEEENKSYWICTDGGYQCECRWTNVNHFWTNLTTDWHWHIMDVPQYSKVVAWMPLPEPYRAERRTDE